ncbi:hypothetical protein [Streptomyces sp. NBC_01716]|uniref:hypothetical protein n=1 Tax=Streptomyces sp. NBC_01716 TaxID=2975917 RepID=UPI002E35EAF9|nr:hypothetical protein [Streptomyces sp. NBC_01716]
MPQPHRREITYSDELLADRTVHRRYFDGRQEWRSADSASRRTVRWRDDRGASGSDELLGRRIVKRVYADGRPVIYGREAGYGRTLWSDGVLTVNRTSFGGRLGTVLAAVTAGAVLGTLAMPPASLSPEEEEEMRRQAEASASGGDGGGAGDAGYGDWDDGSADSDDDFG